MKGIWRKLTSLFLALILTLQLLPVQALAAEANSDATKENLGAVSSESQDATPKDATIVAEIPEGRDKFQKEFRLSNGMNMISIYGSAVHYEEDGEWKEIDNTLRPVSSTGETLSGKLALTSAAAYTNTAGMWDVKLPASLDTGKTVEVSRDGYTLSFQFAGEIHNNHEVMSLEEELATAAFDETESLAINGQDLTVNADASVTQISTSSATVLDLTASVADSPQQSQSDKLYSALQYSDIYANTDLRYDLQSNQLKESVIIKSAKDTLAGYKYVLSAPDMVLELQDDNSIHVYAANAAEGDEPLFYMPAPFLVDDNRLYNDDITVNLQRSGDTYTLTYSLPRAWLLDDERAYPVVLDPVIRPESGIYTISDQTVWSDATTSFTWGCVAVGYTPSQGKARTLIKFRNLPTLTSADVIVGATLSLCLVEYDTAVTMEAHQVLTEWESNTVTWSDIDDADVEWNSVVEDYQIITNPTWYTWDITNIAQGWYADGYNSGVFFKASDEYEEISTHETREFYSSDWGGSVTPVLHIMYLNNSGLEDIWDYTSQSAGRAGTGYVNNFTGNLVWVHNGLSFAGNRMPVSISHVYSANDSNKNEFGLGFGWRTNYNQRIYQWTSPGDNPTTYYVWEDADGTKHYFHHDEGNVYKDEVVSTRTLTIGGSGDQTYAIDDGNGNISYFDNHSDYHRLTKIVNNQDTPSIITVTYRSDAPYQIATITDGSGATDKTTKTATGGRKYVFTYTDNLLGEIAFYGTKAIVEENKISWLTYGYTDSNLTSITYPPLESETTGPNVVYSYEEHLLTSATDSDGYQVLYTYYNDTEETIKRVETIQEKDIDANEDGGYLNIEYAHNQTTFIDHNKNKEIVQFNRFGSTVSIQDGLGRAQFAQYGGDDIKTASQLALSSKLQNTVVDLMRNGGFETNGYWNTVSDSTTGSAGYTSNQTYLGAKAMQLTCDTTCSGRYVYSTTDSVYTAQSGKPYTLSAYVKTTNMNGNGNGAKIALKLSGSGEIVAISEAIKVDSDWTRLEVTYNHPADAAEDLLVAMLFNGSVGTAYFDCVQLEQSPSASRYNLVENGDFSRLKTSETDAYNWSEGDECFGTENRFLYPTDSNNPSARVSAAPQMDRYVYTVTGSPTLQKRCYQDLLVSGSSGDVYTLAGWAKGDSVPLSGDRRFGLILRFYSSNGTQKETLINFNPDTDSIQSWQYTAGRIVAPIDYYCIRVLVVYEYNMNTVYFDGIQLYKEEFGQSYVYDEETGLVKSVIDLQQQETNYEYADNQLTGVFEYLGENKKYIAKYEYDDYNNVTKAIAEDGTITYFAYDIYGNNTAVAVSDDPGLTFIKDEETQKPYGVNVDTGKQAITSFADYTDNGDQLLSVTDSLGKTTTYNYNTDTGLLTSTQAAHTEPVPENETVPTTTYSYDKLHRTSSVTQGVSTVGYSYTNDLLSTITSASGTVYDFAYGDFDLVQSVGISMLDDSNNVIRSRTLISHEYSNDANRYLTQSTYGNGDTISYAYDNYGRTTSKTYEDGDKVEYKYDNNGNLGLVEDSASGRTTKYLYDFQDRLSRYEESGNGYSSSVEWSYNTDNNLTSQTHILNGTTYTTEYSYDDETKRLTGSGQGTISTEYGYDSLGRMTGITEKNSGSQVVHTTIGYTNKESTSSITSSKVASWANSVGGSYTYEYDARGNIRTVFDGTHTTRYTYDDLDQLIREDNEAEGKTWVYTYAQQGDDEGELKNGGNITSKKEYAYTTGTLGTLESEIVYQYTDSAWKDLLTRYNGVELEYEGDDDDPETNSIGNLEDDGTWTYTWEHGRQLKEIDQIDTEFTRTNAEGNLVTYVDPGALVQFKYDADGRRIAKTSHAPSAMTSAVLGEDGKYYIPLAVYAEWEYHYAGDQLAAITCWDELIMSFTYDAIGPATVTYEGDTYYYIRNAQGDITGIVGLNEEDEYEQVVSYTYDAWGKLLSTTGSMASTLGVDNPFRYRGYVYDTETGLYYLQSRYYNPNWGRFINADGYLETGGVLGNNFFAYCLNNPVNMSDAEGNLPKWLATTLAVAAGVVVAATIAATLPAAACMASVSALMYVGAGAKIAAGITYAIGAIASISAGAFAAEGVYSAATGESLLLDTVFNGNTEAYSTAATITTLVSGGLASMAAAGASMGVCFVAGTLIATNNGKVPIQDIQAGDMVWASNPATGELVLKPVVQTFVNETKELVHIHVDGEEIICTPEHPFYSPVLGWTEAIQLRAGDILVTVNGEYVVVEQVQHEILEAPTKVYNFEVQDFHTYYVGHRALLVHNACSNPKKQIKVDTRAQAFNVAKREIGVPTSSQPTAILPNIDKKGNVVPGRVYSFGDNGYIRDDIAGHSFKDGGYMGKHFNTSTGLHIFYD